MHEETIFAAARLINGAAERQSYLDQACIGNPRLREDVERLLQADAQAGSLLDRPPPAPTATASETTATDDVDQNRWRSILSPTTRPGSLGRMGSYEVLELIGRGGMGIVCRGLDLKLNRVNAIKALVPELAANPMARKRFLREAQAAAAVSHDHVVTIHAVEDEGPVPFIVMECVIGRSLQQKIDRTGALKLTEILRIGMQIAMGLAAAHKQGLIHRDIKPANILLENGVERVKITDFGLARAVDDVGVTQSGVIAGTPQYMSPEQGRGELLDQRSDLFSLGSLLYTMCTGRPAFRGDNPIAVIRRVCDDTPRPIRELNPEIPESLTEVIDRLLAKEPQDRFASAAEVAAILEQQLAAIQQADGNSGHRAIVPVTRNEDQSSRVSTATDRVWLVISVISLCILVGLVIPKLWREMRTAPTQTPLAVGNSGTLHAATSGIPDTPTSTATGDTQTSKTAGNPAATGGNTSGSVPATPPLAIAPFNATRATEFQTEWAKHLQVPVELKNSIGMTFRLIPPGEFQMGSTQEELIELAKDLEQSKATDFDRFVAHSSAPRHLVRLTQPFYLGQFEVTVGQYRQFVEATGYRGEADPERRLNWRDFAAGEQAARQPVVGISWEDAQAFCRWLSQKEQRTYDLPTEAQWEFACRAGSHSLWSHGDDPQMLESHAIFGLTGTPHPAEVGLKQANAWGLYDMHGNADEWCLDWHQRDFYARSPLVEPVNLDVPNDPASGRVARGGSWNSAGWWSRTAIRAYDFPTNPVHPKGFRVVIRGHLRGPDADAPTDTAVPAEAFPATRAPATPEAAPAPTTIPATNPAVPAESVAPPT